MQTHSLPDRLRQELHGLALTFLLVVATTLGIFAIIEEVGLTRGTVAYMIPVLIAAIRWGLVASLFASLLGVLGSAFFFFPPLYSLEIRDPQEVINLTLYVFSAVTVSQVASRLKRELELSRQREIDFADLYSFSRRLAVAFEVSEIQSAIEDHLTAVMQRKVLLFGGTREAKARRGPRQAPLPVIEKASALSSGQIDAEDGATVASENGDVWLVRAVSAKSPEYGVIAVNLGRASKEGYEAQRSRLDHVLSDATATLERLGVAHAISEARMRAQTDQLREALIGSVSHELRTPLASILGAATVLATAPPLQNEPRLKALAQGVRDEAERLNNDIQNLLDATRISSDGVKPRVEWADPTDIVHSAIDGCRRRLTRRRLQLDLAPDLPLIQVDPILLQQALVQIIDNAVKYSQLDSRIVLSARVEDGRMIVSVRDEGAGLSEQEQARMWDRFARGERHLATTSGSGLGLWIASAFVAANGGTIGATSEGPGRGTTVSIDLPVTQTAIPQLESETDE